MVMVGRPFVVVVVAAAAAGSFIHPSLLHADQTVPDCHIQRILPIYYYFIFHIQYPYYCMRNQAKLLLHWL